MPTFPESLGDAVTRAAQLGGVIAFCVEALVILVIFRSLAAFRSEMEAVDGLVAEYVRCRDFLLANRRASAESGWRTTEGGAFREAWQNFNTQLGKIRARHEAKNRRFALLLSILLALFFVNIFNWMSPRGVMISDLNQILAVTGHALSGLLLWFAASHITRSHRGTIHRRTVGDYLISPWPGDAGSADRQYSAFAKFLPVEGGLAESAPEAL